MSRRELALLECGNCGHQFEAGIWAEFHVEHDWDPCGSINYFECEECGWEGPVRYPLKVVGGKSGKTALFVPPSAVFYDEDEDATCFEVVLLGGETPMELVYNDFLSLWRDLALWGCDEDDFYYIVKPSEESVEKALANGIISEEESALLKGTDWNRIEETWPTSPVDDTDPDLSDDEERALKVNYRLMMGLQRLGNIVSLEEIRRQREQETPDA